MLIAVPSKGRAGKTKTDKILKEHCTFFVPQSELHQYQDFVENVIPVPNDIQGITKTRNWILDNTKEVRVAMVDDDVKSCGYTKLHERHTTKVDKKEPEFWLDEFQKLFDVTEQMGYKIWGIRTESAPRGTYPYTPFLFKSYITASCMGIINDKEYRFDENFPVKEDYEICLRHIVEKGGIISCKYIHWENDHWHDPGGCKDYRTVDMERKAILDLTKKYPGMIRSAKRKANEFTIQLNL